MTIVTLVILVTSLGPVEDITQTKPMTYPATRRVEQVDEFHGVKVADPYRWLEADVRQSEEVQTWIDSENVLTQSFLSTIPEREPIEKRLTEIWNYPKYTAPSQVGGKYFFRKNNGLQNQGVLYVTDAIDGTPRVLIDPNQWSEDGTIALASVAPSDDGNKIAYSVSEAGSDWKTIRVIEVPSGRPTGDELRWIRWGSVQWNQAGNGFYYSRYPEPDEGQEYQSLALNQMVYFHRLGTSQSQDELIYQRPDEPEWSFSVTVTEDDQYLVMEITKSTDDQNQVFYRPINGDNEWTELIGDFENQFWFIGNQEHRFYFLTDLEAPTKRVVAMNLDQPGRAHIQEIIPAASETLQWVGLVNQQLIAGYLKDALSQVRIFDLAGQWIRDVEFPGPGTASGFGGHQNDTETFYSFSSYTIPSSIYHYDLKTGKSRLWHQSEVAVDVSQFESHQVFYTSKDGTRIPMILAHKKGVVRDGNNPTLLYGYGGFNISLTPRFSISYLAWMEMGGIVAVPNLRGGGEYGEQWHLAGKTVDKQNVFDDFIAAAEWLIRERYTSTPRLAIRGGSNGGLLVGAVMTQRPELFGACLPAVGVMDMLRYHRFTAGRFWVDEYGSIDNSDHFAALLKYSPYHNLKPGNYPATLISTADTDDRVVPMHSFKFAAALQHAQQGPAPVLIRIETRAGHGAGTPTTKLIESTADYWAFLVKTLNMELPNTSK